MDSKENKSELYDRFTTCKSMRNVIEKDIKDATAEQSKWLAKMYNLTPKLQQARSEHERLSNVLGSLTRKDAKLAQEMESLKKRIKS